MQELLSSMIGVDQGENVLFSDFESNGEMWIGTGPRERRRKVRFARTYLHPPAVFVTLSMWDMDNATNARADMSAKNISKTGFELVFRTWGDTRVARARVRWMAIGPLVGDDDWEIN